jgi:phosphatidylglycerophosphate synthase
MSNVPSMVKPWDARLAARLVAPFVHSPHIHPNHFTALRLVVGLLGVYAFARAEAPSFAACCIVASNFLDHTDGELARASGKSSRFGHVFDLIADALVTIGMLVGIGIGLRATLGSHALVLGVIAGCAVAAIFYLRNVLEAAHGKSATRQARLAGFEAEDVLYLLPLVTVCDALPAFLYAAGVGAPVACAIVFAIYRRTMCTAGGGT